MIEKIGKRLTEIISPIVPVNLSEAETESYPYAVYDYIPEPKVTKDGVVGYRAETTLSIMSPSYDEAHGIFEQIASAIETGMRSAEMYANILNWSPECEDGIWSINISLTINQHQ